VLYQVRIDGGEYTVELQRDEGSLWRCRVGDQAFTVDAVESGRGTLSILIDGRSFAITLDQSGDTDLLVLLGQRYTAEVRDPRALRDRGSRSGSEGPRNLTSPMPGRVVRVLAPAGTHVEAGAGVMVVEAMKMQNEIKSPKAGVVRKINVLEGAAVNSGDVLAIVE
jgi:biotin carboxyl carrier protein